LAVRHGTLEDIAASTLAVRAVQRQLLGVRNVVTMSSLPCDIADASRATTCVDPHPCSMTGCSALTALAVSGEA
jgi:hypothetical protein